MYARSLNGWVKRRDLRIVGCLDIGGKGGAPVTLALVIFGLIGKFEFAVGHE